MPKKLPMDPDVKVVVKYLSNRRVKFTEIANKTGLSPGWLSMLAGGRIVDPSYTRVKILKAYIENQAL
jgi:hypothetical protein